MEKSNMSTTFIKWVKLLFTNASAAVNLNGSPGENFKIERGVRQGCPLAPYLFLIVGEVLTHVIKKAVTDGRLRGITLPGGTKQQCISQYADDSSFMVKGEKRYVDELVRILKVFSAASGMEINWEKSCAYWFDKYTHKPEWLNGYNWQWATEGDLSKLLGTPFGLNLNTRDVDQFLYNKIAKKLDYWSKMKLSLAGRAVICNQVLLSTLWFFITVWGGSNKILGKVKGAIRNYLWSGKEQLTRTRVSWRECCLKKKEGGLGLVDPEAAKTSLLCKWVVKAMEPGESNLQLMLRYRLARFNPQRGRSWGISLDWFTNKLHQGFPGSKVWGHISKAWKIMVKGLYQIPPRTRMELLHSNIWWSDGVELLKRGFTYAKGLHLYRKGIQCVDDVWDSTQQDFLTWERAQEKFGLMDTESGDWEEMTEKLSDQWRHLLETDEDTAYAGQWLGLYVDGKEDPAIVFRCDKDFTPECLKWYTVTLPFPVQCYTVGTYSRCLREWEQPLGEMEGFFHKVKIIHTNRGPKKEGEKEPIIFFYGKLATLGWDPDRWRWIDGGYFLDYTIKAGREAISNRNPGSTRARDKWQGYLPSNYRFFWSQVWDPLRSGKEAAFMWSIWHKAVAVNEWRARIAPASISRQCVFCLPNTSESVKHKFWDCIQARRAWRWATFIMHELCGVRSGNYDTFNWKQALFGERIPKKYGKMIKVWHLLRGITLWTIWIERNDKVFNQEQWNEFKLKQRIWDELIIYAKAAWTRVLEQIKISSFSAEAMLNSFDRTWGARSVLCRRRNLLIEWNWKRQVR
jgi:hypothetical protein